MTHFGNPALERFAESTRITLEATDCQVHLFPNPGTKYSECDRIQDFLSKRSLSYETHEAGAKPVTRINDAVIEGWDEAKLTTTLKSLGYPATAKAEDVNVPMLVFLVWIQLVYVTM